VTADLRPWEATIRVRTRPADVAGWLVAALSPEAAREVPRAGATITETPPDGLTIVVDAADAGAMRAALNTYLGWVDLAARTARGAAPPALSK